MLECASRARLKRVTWPLRTFIAGTCYFLRPLPSPCSFRHLTCLHQALSDLGRLSALLTLERRRAPCLHSTICGRLPLVFFHFCCFGFCRISKSAASCAHNPPSHVPFRAFSFFKFDLLCTANSHHCRSNRGCHLRHLRPRNYGSWPPSRSQVQTDRYSVLNQSGGMTMHYSHLRRLAWYTRLHHLPHKI